MGEIGRLTFIRRLGIPKRSGISQFQFLQVHLRYLATLFKNLMNVSPLTPEFKSMKGVHLLIDQLFGYAAPLSTDK